MSLVASGLGITTKAPVGVTNPVSAIPGHRGGFFGGILESFPGAWQRNVVLDSADTMLASSAVYSCISLIANDISKLRIKLVERVGEVWRETSNSAYSPVLRKPNRYQTRIQFLSQWIVMKLIHGNTYVLKERDERGVVTALYVLNSRLVTPLVSEDGGVYYQIGQDTLSGLSTSITVPASEILHDRCVCLFHPLIGVPPLFACAMSSTQGNRIQANSAKFFENMSRPSGHLTTTGTIDDVTAERLKREFEVKFSGANIGKVLVTGDGLKYEPMTIPAIQAQLIDQLRWTAEDVAGAFLVPLYKISKGSDTKLKNAAQQDQDYYKQTLQHHIEAIELLLDEGLGLTGGQQMLGVELDLDGLLRMDPVQRAERSAALINARIMSPNEGRGIESLLPVPGGEEPFGQMQDVPLSLLAEQFKNGGGFGAQKPAAAPALPAPADPQADPAKAFGALAVVIEDFKRGIGAADEKRQARDTEIAEHLRLAREAAESLRARDDERLERALETVDGVTVAVQATDAQLREQLVRISESAEAAELARAERAHSLHVEQVAAIKAIADEIRGERDVIQERRAAMDEEAAVRGFFDILTKGLEHV